MTTAQTIATGALQELGVADAGQTPSPEDSQVCLDALNLLADAWLTEPNYAYSKTMVSATLPANTQSLTIGTSQSINCARPVRLEDPGCYVRIGTLDFPLRVVSEAEYNGYVLKSLQGPWPLVCMYDKGSPTGNVYFWPTGACTVYLMVLTQVSQFADLTTPYTLLPGYARAFKLTLMEEVAGVFGKVLTPLQTRNAAQARRFIKRANFTVPQLDVGGGDPDLPNIYAIRAG